MRESRITKRHPGYYVDPIHHDDTDNNPSPHGHSRPHRQRHSRHGRRVSGRLHISERHPHTPPAGWNWNLHIAPSSARGLVCLQLMARRRLTR